jgi:hypothetical protein
MATTDHSVQLKPETFQALEAEAERRHLAPDELADELMREQLQQTATRRTQMREALDALHEFSKTMPRVDAVQLIHDVRDAEADRGLPWPSS